MNESNVSGKFDQISGKVKQSVGEAFGNEKLANEGAADEIKGHGKEAWGNVKDAVTDHSDVKTEEAKLHAEQTGDSLRDKATSAAEHVKESINHGLDHLKGTDHA